MSLESQIETRTGYSSAPTDTFAVHYRGKITFHTTPWKKRLRGGGIGEGSVTGEPERWGFERYAKFPVGGPPSPQVPLGEPGGGSFAGTFERKEKCIWFPFLDPEVIRILSMNEAIASLRHIYTYIWVASFWTQRILGKLVQEPPGTLSKEQESFKLVQKMGYKGPVLRLRCIGPGKGSNPYTILFYSILFYSILFYSILFYSNPLKSHLQQHSL